MYELLIRNHKSVSLNARQFRFLKIIGQLGFLNFNQLTLLWSTVSQTYSSFSHSMLRKWINQYQLLKTRPVKKYKPSELSRPVYYLSPAGIRMLTKYHTDYIPSEYLKFNPHNEQCNEVTIQTLFKAAFDIDLINNPKQEPLNSNLKYLIASSHFNLDQIDLRPWAKQVPDYKKYPFVPDQMISFNQDGHRCEIMIELDNRTEDNQIQIQKIINYMVYANNHPNKRILMVIAIADGSLTSFKLRHYRPVYKKIHNLLEKFKNKHLRDSKRIYSLGSIYRKIHNLTITVAGVREAHIDLSDFITNKNPVVSYYLVLNALAKSIATKLGKKVVFQINRKLMHTNLDYISWQNKVIGYMVYNSNPSIYQPVLVGYEHTLDTCLDLFDCIPKGCIYAFPLRPRKLLTPAIPKYHLKQYDHPLYEQGMVYQPVLEDNINPNWLLQLLFAKQRYYRYLYKFFTTGKISASDKTNYSKLTYLTSIAHLSANQYLQLYHIKLQATSSRNYRILRKLALQSSSPKEFAKQLNPEEIPLELISSIFHQLSIKAFSSPYLPTSSIHQRFNPINYLFWPDTANPYKRAKILF